MNVPNKADVYCDSIMSHTQADFYNKDVVLGVTSALVKQSLLAYYTTTVHEGYTVLHTTSDWGVLFIGVAQI